MNMFTFTITLISIFFWAFLAGVYFLKPNLSNIDNKIYKYILILDFFQITLSLICLITAYYLNYHWSMMVIYDITARFFCVTQMMWYFSLMLYALIITSTVDSKFRKAVLGTTRFGQIIRLIFIALLLLIIWVLPVDYAINPQGILVYDGGRTNVMFYSLIFTVPIEVVYLVIKRKTYEFKKVILFPIIIGFQITAFIISKIDTSINMYPLTITLISYLMYHTIENPDIKLITRLQQAKETAEKSNKEKTDFLASMSHELRTPLNAIVGLTSIIVDSDNKEQIKEDGKDILKAANNLQELVEGMLDINNLESDNIELQEESYNPKYLFEDLIRVTKIKLVDKDITFRTNFSSRIPAKLYGDREKLKRVINNLLTNAVKYTEKGYVDFNVDCENNSDTCTLKITVRDTGRGIKEDQKQFLFTKFYRLEEDKDSDIGGTGLGLAVTKSLLDIMNGEIEVYSIYEQGTSFTIHVPQKIEKLEEEIEML